MATLFIAHEPPLKTLKPAPFSVSGVVTSGGVGVVTDLFFLTTYGLLLGTARSATDGSYSFATGLDVPILVVALGASGERPLAHMVAPG